MRWAALLVLVACGDRPPALPGGDEPATELLVPLAPVADPSARPRSTFQGVFAELDPPEGATVDAYPDHLAAVWTDGSSAAERAAQVGAQLEAIGFEGAPAREGTEGGLTRTLTRDGRMLVLGASASDGVTVVTLTDLGRL